ncbi:MAG: class I SAM-dependent methyltransferase, partial [Betaproteobacteria bacterium]|nr:class I SAM-dependent methyltransferase [Betaproteobacteria bacterium]
EKIAAHEARAEMQTCRLDLMNDPLPAQRFDLIYTSMTLHHVPDTARILALFHDLLKPGGYLCIADLDLEDGSFHGLEYDVHPGFDRTALAGLAQAAGLAAARFRTVFEIVKERASGQRAYPVFLLTTQKPA